MSFKAAEAARAGVLKAEAADHEQRERQKAAKSKPVEPVKPAVDEGARYGTFALLVLGFALQSFSLILPTVSGIDTHR